MAGPCFLGIDVSIRALVAVMLFKAAMASKLNATQAIQDGQEKQL
jgi:hypothetical protein